MKYGILCLAICAAVLLAGCTPVSEEPPDTGTESVTILSDTVPEDYVSPVYKALSPEEKELYDKVTDAVVDFREEVSFGETVPRDTIRKIYRLVYAQERKYFWLSSLFYAPGDEVSSLRLSYVYDREDAALKQAELDSAADEILAGLPENASDFDAAVYFHDTIITGCTFSQSEDHVNSAYGVLVSGYGQCEGYAAAMSFLCDKKGIPNYMVCGTNERGETHAWNRVLIGGEWYNIDCTWDDPILSRDDPDFIRHDYCLVRDEEIIGITHFPDELYDGLPPCTSWTKNYFYGKDLVFDSAAEASKEIKEQIKEAGLSGKREAELRFSDDDAYYAAMARFFDSGEIKRIIDDVNSECGTDIVSAYKHNNDKMDIVHISLIYGSDEQ